MCFYCLLALRMKLLQTILWMNKKQCLKLADIAIALYAAESAVLRTEKSIATKGEENSALKVQLTEALIDDTLFEVEMIARNCLRVSQQERSERQQLPM